MEFPSAQPIISYTHRLRSRYGETDKMGYVYYGRYLEYFEAARTEMIRSLGYPYQRLEQEGIMLPVIHAELEYKSPVFYDELMNIQIEVFEVPEVRLHTFYKLFTDRMDTPHVLGRVSLCFMKDDTRRPCKAPLHFIENLKRSTHVG